MKLYTHARLRHWSARTLSLFSIIALSAAFNVYAQPLPLHDDFQDGATEGWTFFTTNTASAWRVVTDPADAANLVLVQGSNTNNESYASTGNVNWQDYSLESRVRLDNTEPYPGIIARYKDSNNYYMLRINKVSEARVEISKKVAGASTIFASVPLATKTNTWYALRLTLRGNVLRGYLDGNALFEVTDAALNAGMVGFRNNWGPASFDDVSVAELDPAVPGPAGLSAGNITSASITLNWNSTPGAVAYQLYRASSAGGPFLVVYKGTTPSFLNSALTQSTDYYYKTSSIDVNGIESASSEAVYARTTAPFPGTPSNLKLYKVNSLSAEFRWSPGTSAASYNLYRATQPGGPYTLVDPVNRPNYIGTSALDAALEPQKIYYFVVTSVNESGESAMSNEVKVTTPRREDDLIQNSGFWAASNTTQIIQAHAGSITKFGNTYYWYGEDKRHNGASLRAVSIYTSQDLIHWEFRDNALTTASAPELGDSNPSGAKIERPKVLYNNQSGKYVLWGHKEPRDNYNEARLCVAVSDTPDGEFTYLGSFRPDPVIGGTGDSDPNTGDESRDFNAFKDDDGTAYLICVTRGNLDLTIYRLTPDYLHVQERVALLYPGQRREAPAVVKKDGIYYMLHSGQSGWAPNQGRYSTAATMVGPWTATPPTFGDNWSFYTQPAFILTVPGTETTTYMYIGDRWHPTRLGASEYVWLPLKLDSGTVSMDYVPEFKFNVVTGALIVPEVHLISGSAMITADRSTASFPASQAGDGSYATYWESSNRTLPVSVNVDLGHGEPVGRVDLTWRGIGGSEAYYQYKLYGSTDGVTFIELVDRSTNEDLGFTSDTISRNDYTPYRYLRITVARYINFTNGSTPGYNPGLYEIKVFSKPPLSAYDQWKVDQGLPVDSADTTTPTVDGISILFKYATLGSVSTSDPSPVLLKTEGGVPSLSFKRRVSSSISYQIESSNDLSTWTPLASLAAGASSWTGSATVTESAVGTDGRDVSVTAIPNDSPRFLRVAVTHDGTTVRHQPVGFLTVALTAGASSSYLGQSLLSPAIYRANVAAVGPAQISVNGAPLAPGAFAASPHWLRVLTGAQAGRHALITGNDSSSLTVDLRDGSGEAAPLNISGWSVASGDAIEIAPADTLASLFGDLVAPGASLFAADTVGLWDGTRWVSYYRSSTQNAWLGQFTGLVPQDNLVIAPQRSWVLTRRAGRPAMNVLFSGAVPESAQLLRHPGAGTTMTTLRFPIAQPLSHFAFAGPGSWNSASSMTTADTIGLWDGARWVSYWRTPEGQWRKQGDATDADYSSLAIAPGRAVSVLRRTPASSSALFFSQPQPYSDPRQ